VLATFGKTADGHKRLRWLQDRGIHNMGPDETLSIAQGREIAALDSKTAFPSISARSQA
jgi:hypothetical protein